MRTFANGLKFLGYETWLDQRDMPMGATLEGALKTSVENCDCLIAWLNKEYMNSDWCKAELLYAKQLGKIVIRYRLVSMVISENTCWEILSFYRPFLFTSQRLHRFLKSFVVSMSLFLTLNT